LSNFYNGLTARVVTDHLILQFCHSVWLKCYKFSAVLIRSTPPSRPNTVGLKCPSVRPQKVTSISMKFDMYVEVDE